jgi:hypothetical protein
MLCLRQAQVVFRIETNCNIFYCFLSLSFTLIVQAVPRTPTPLATSETDFIAKFAKRRLEIFQWGWRQNITKIKSITRNSRHPLRHSIPSHPNLAIYDRGGRELNGTKLKREIQWICLREGNCSMRVGQCHYEGMCPSHRKQGLKYVTFNPTRKHARVHCGGVDVISKFLRTNSPHVLLPFTTWLDF